jgi:hypothetical protein
MSTSGLLGGFGVGVLGAGFYSLRWELGWVGHFDCTCLHGYGPLSTVENTYLKYITTSYDNCRVHMFNSFLT